tara:strand:+ start:58751 stop:59668 length:918 start_codon:yes stop_codon:yes gene_type:complete
MTPIVGLLQLLGIGFLLYASALVFYTIWALTHPPRVTYASAIHRGLPGDPSELESPCAFTEETIKGTKGELPIWIIPGKNTNGPRVIFTHGWGSSRQGGLKRIDPFIESASEIILWDLPGHGDAEGFAQMGTNEHHDLARILETRVNGNHRETLLFGWSMGAGITLAFANEYTSKFHIVGVICESPYVHAITPARNVIRLKGVPYRINLRPAMSILGIILGVGPKWQGFARDELARGVQSQVLIIHGRVDPVSPIQDGIDIERAAQDAKIFILDDAGHNNLWSGVDGVFHQESSQAISAFIANKV